MDEDEIIFRAKDRKNLDRKTWTQRKFLSFESNFYDLLGIISPFLIRAKSLLQELWTRNGKAKEDCVKETELLGMVGVNSMVGGTALGDTMERHIFGNPSLEAAAAVAYITITRNQETLTRFLMVKRRVWPLLQTTIHRVKLQVTLYAAILKKTIEDGINFKFDEIFRWSDSTNVHNKPDKKRRICNAKAPQSGTNLNDKFLAGPDLLGNMLGFLLRFREVAIAIQGDIKAMFMQT